MPYLRIGHRGAAGTCPEHTRSAFARAIELGVDMIELDVQLTRDGELVVLHDLELGRTVKASGFVRDWGLDALRGLDAGSWFGPAFCHQSVLSLGEVLDLTVGRVQLNVEIKSPRSDWAGTAASLVKLLDERRAMRSTIVSSFDLGALRAVREVSPTARVGVLWQDAECAAAWTAAAELAAESFHPWWIVTDASVVAEAHARGLSVIVWTVNEPADIARLAALGVDGIISDFPERLGGGIA